jgi:neutral ceramidase
VIRLLAILIALLICGACSSCTGPRLTSAPQSPAVRLERGLQGGVARADITPPPGLGLFGHGPEGRVATGFRLRLYCRPIVLADEGDVIALVPCDLAAISIELHRAVASKLIAHGVPIGGDRLFLSATHTHAGPAHYFGARSYSGAFASREYGFDDAVLDWLAERIADGVDSAFRRRQPACAGWGFTEVYGLSRNRSYEAFAANTTLPSALDPTMHFGLSKEITPGQLAVDPLLSVLRIDARRPNSSTCVHAHPLGAFAVFGMHPTAIANTADVYHGDVFGFATRHAESLIEDGAGEGGAIYPSPSTEVIVGLANGIEGDVSPAWDRQSPVEARRIGVALGRRIHDVFDSIVTAPGVSNEEGGSERLQHAYRDLSFPNAQASYDPSERLCPAPEIGVSAAGGAEDGPTRFRALREFNEGVRLERPRESCHGHRLPLIGPDGPPKADGLELPAWAPIGVARVAGKLIAFVPVELTTVAGLRIRERLMITSGASKTTPIVGLTNAYLQYVTTADEYALQHYEGASNLYGPFTATFLENQVAYLGRIINGVSTVPCPPQSTAINDVRAIPYDPQRARVRHIPEAVLDADDSIELEDLPVEKLVVEGQPAFRIAWRGTPPNAMAYRMRLSVRVVDEVGRMLDDDRGSNMEVRSHASAPLEKENAWSAVWMPPVLQRSRCPDDYMRERSVRFEIVGPVPRRSALFPIACRATDERKLVR